MPTLNTRLLAVAAIMPAILVMAGCGVKASEAAAPETVADAAATPLAVEASRPHRGAIHATYEATATIDADADAPVPARVGGELVALLVEEGDRVTAGQALARLDGERLRLEMLAARAELDKARADLERNRDLHARGLIAAATFDGLTYDLEALDATWQRRKLEYEYATIRAPIAGVIAERHVRPGQHVDAGDIVFRVTDTTTLYAYLRIPQTEIAKFAAGHDAGFVVDADPGHEFAARIVRVSPTIDTRNGTFRATAAIDNSSGTLAPGMFARFVIRYERHDDALLIPSAALIREDSATAVFVIEDDTAIRRDVRIGIEAGGRAEVLDGLDDRDTVIVVGQHAVRDGSKVQAGKRVSAGNSTAAGHAGSG